MDSVFYLGRHGLTDDDMPNNDKVSGWLEIPLNELGKGNARKAGRFLRGKGITSITSSDTKRALQTARIISEITGVPVVESPKLRSWNMGEMQGMFHKAANPFLSFFQHNPDLIPPKGEPFRRFYNRFKAVWQATVSYVKKFPNAKPLLITHSQNLDIITWFIRDIQPGKDIEFGQGIAPGGVLEARISEDGKVSIRKLRV